MNILIRGGTVIALEEDGGVQAGADVAISDGRIAFVGDAPVGFRPDEIVDATGHLVLPGLTNAHLHSGTVLSRGLSGRDGPEPWFDLGVTCDGQPPLPNAPPMTAEDARWAALLTAAELDSRRRRGLRRPVLLHGGRGGRVRESGLRANLAWCAFGGDGGEIGGDIADVAAWTERWQGAGGGRTGTPSGAIAVNNGTISQAVAPGQYTSTEAAKAGWDLTALSCDDANSTGSLANRQATFNVEAGESVTYTFTNSKQGQVIVKKVMVGGTDSFSYTGTPSGAIAVNNGTISQAVAPGQYTSTEAAKAGWDLTALSCDDANSTGSLANRQATFNVEAGESVTCTFTNSKQGQVIVKKVMVGGTDSFSYTGTPSGAIAVNNGTISQAVAPGKYTSTEAAKAGWDLTALSCDDANSTGSLANRQATFNVEAGESVTCTFTNTKRGQIVVQKQTNPDGDPQSFSFNASYDADGFALSDGQSNDSGDLDPGTYSVSENVPQGWDLDSATCDDGSNPSSIGLAAGETVTCVFTNEKDAHIVVQKQTEPNADPQVFAFSASYDQDGYSLADGQSNDSGDLDPGTYSVSENVPSGWDLSSVRVLGSEPRERDLAAGRRDRDLRVHEHEARNDHRREADSAGQGVRKLLVQRSCCRLDRGRWPDRRRQPRSGHVHVDRGRGPGMELDSHLL